MVIETCETTWAGQAAMSAGVGLFLGKSGDSDLHRHWAHQIVVALSGEVEVFLDNTKLQGKGFWIPAGKLHKIGYSDVVSLYFDRTLSSSFLSTLNSNSICTLSDELVKDMMLCMFNNEDIQVILGKLKELFRIEHTEVDNERLNHVLSKLKQGIMDGEEFTLSQTADFTSLSPSRFSHWFSEQTGMPMRSYKKWLKLMMGFELSRDMSLADAAIGAGFSDQAHFCRAIRNAFGVRAKTVKMLLTKE